MAIDQALIALGQRLSTAERRIERVGVREQAFAHTVADAVLAADVNLTNTGTYFAGPAITIGPGTFWVSGALTLVDTVQAAGFALAVSDGSNTYRSGACTSGAANWEMQLSFGFPIVLTTSKTITAYAKDITSVNGKIRAASNYAAAGNTASWISAMRIG